MYALLSEQLTSLPHSLQDAKFRSEYAGTDMWKARETKRSVYAPFVSGDNLLSRNPNRGEHLLKLLGIQDSLLHKVNESGVV